MKKNFLFKQWVICAVLLFMTAFTAKVYSQLNTSDCNLNGWQVRTSGTSQLNFENGPGLPPLPIGSAEFNVGPDGGGASQLKHPGYEGVRLADMNQLSYWSYQESGGSGGQAVYIILHVDLDGNLGTAADQTLLFFEPVYQTAVFFPSNPQPPVVVGAWQMWDARNGGWWSTTGVAGASPGTGVKPLNAIIALHPNAVIHNRVDGDGGVRLVAGFGAGAWDNFIGNADAFSISVLGNNTTYNFESCDPDGDGILSPNDNCPSVPNPDQTNTDGDAEGDACDADDDNDGIPDTQDNCPLNSNQNQQDTDQDGLGNACDPDDDNDGLPDNQDNCPLTPNNSLVCFLAYNAVSTTGNQAYEERLGMVFTANSPIVVKRLGAFDDGGDGLNRPITVGIIDAAGATVVGPITLFGAVDPLAGGHRTRVVPSVTLPAGQYTIVAVGYGPGEMNGNNNLGGGYPNSHFSNGGGLITSNSSSYGGFGYGPPTTPHPDPNEFHAGTFCFAGPVSQNPDTDGDGLGNPCDIDDDNDGVNDFADPNDSSPDICGDSDNDGCDDCSVGTDNFGPLPDNNPANDGLDTDGDGLCNSGDPDDDNDGVPDGQDCNPLDPSVSAEQTYYADLDGDGFGDPNNCEDFCLATPPPGYVTNNHDCDDTKADGKVIMCHKGKQHCVKEKDIQKHLEKGWTLGPCTTCETGETLMCNGKGEQECVKDKDVDKKLQHGWSIGTCPCDGTALRNITSVNRGTEELIEVDLVRISAFPNPLSQSTTIRYELPAESKVNITLYDPMGRLVSTLVDAARTAGVYNYTLDASRLAAGVYYYKMTVVSGEKTVVQSQKLMIVK